MRRFFAIAVLLAATPHAVADGNDALADPTFSGDGQLTLPGGDTDEGQFIVPTPDGGYWFVASTKLPGMESYRIRLHRYDANGVVVPGFGGSSGIVTNVQGVPIGSAFLDSQSRLVVGVTGVGPAPDGVARFLPSGAPDPSFGGGQWSTPGNDTLNELIFDIAPAPGDAIWVSKQANPMFANAELMRVTSAGQVDGSFAPITDAQLGSVPLNRAPLAIDELGKLVWAPLGLGPSSPGLVVRLTAAGAVESQVPFNPQCTPVTPLFGDVAALPGGTVVVRWQMNNDDTIGMVATTANSVGPVRCFPGESLRRGVGVAARDATRVFAASASCGTTVCGPALERYVIGAGGVVQDDATFDAALARQVFPQMATGYGSSVVVDDGKPMMIGSITTGVGQVIPAIVRYGGSDLLHADGFE